LALLLYEPLGGDLVVVLAAYASFGLARESGTLRTVRELARIEGKGRHVV
jgi:hypothetical protein